MAEPNPEVVEQALANVAAVLDAGAATLDVADWASHDALVNSLMDVTTAFYLRTQPSSGFLEPTNIWPDFGANLLNFGCFASTVAPLVAQLDAIVSGLEVGAALVPEQDQIDIANMRSRLTLYQATLAAAAPEGPDASVWTRVTLPLLLGYYPPDFAEAGIIEPKVKSPPDVVRPYTLGFQAALVEAAQRERWQLLGADLLANSRGVVRWTLAIPARVGEAIVAGAKAVVRGSRKLLIGSVAAAGIAGAVYLGTRKG